MLDFWPSLRLDLFFDESVGWNSSWTRFEAESQIWNWSSLQGIKYWFAQCRSRKLFEGIQSIGNQSIGICNLNFFFCFSSQNWCQSKMKDCPRFHRSPHLLPVCQCLLLVAQPIIPTCSLHWIFRVELLAKIRPHLDHPLRHSNSKCLSKWRQENPAKLPRFQHSIMGKWIFTLNPV